MIKKRQLKEGKTVLRKAQELIYGDRQKAYGSARMNLMDTAAGWKVILSKRNSGEYVDIQPEDVALMMIWLKICRQTNKPSRDNIVDICGYAGCIEKVEKNL